MRIAFISDIHANIDALTAVINEIRNEQADEIYCLGDICGAPALTDQIIDTFNNQNIIAIAGNCDVASREERSSLSKKAINYLMELEKTKRIKKGYARILLFHGMPSNPEGYLGDNVDLTDFQKVMADEPADIYVFGHVHRPYVKMVNQKVFINCGSVGRSMLPGLANYALMDIDKNSVAVQIVNVSYGSGIGLSGKSNNKLASLI